MIHDPYYFHLRLQIKVCKLTLLLSWAYWSLYFTYLCISPNTTFDNNSRHDCLLGSRASKSDCNWYQIRKAKCSSSDHKPSRWSVKKATWRSKDVFPAFPSSLHVCYYERNEKDKTRGIGLYPRRWKNQNGVQVGKPIKITVPLRRWKSVPKSSEAFRKYPSFRGKISENPGFQR